MNDVLTKHFGIAPLFQMPEGVEITSLELEDGVDIADVIQKIEALNLPEKPYWRLDGSTLQIITDPNPERISRALFDVFPAQERHQSYQGRRIS